MIYQLRVYEPHNVLRHQAEKEMLGHCIWEGRQIANAGDRVEITSGYHDSLGNYVVEKTEHYFLVDKFDKDLDKLEGLEYN